MTKHKAYEMVFHNERVSMGYPSTLEVRLSRSVDPKKQESGVVSLNNGVDDEPKNAE